MRDLSRLLHTLEGCAGNLSALRVLEATRCLAASCEAGEDIEALIAPLEQALCEVFTMAADLPLTEEGGGVVALTAHAWAELDRALERQSMEARRLWRAIKGGLAGNEARPAEIDALLAVFDFKQARVKVKELARLQRIEV